MNLSKRSGLKLLLAFLGTLTYISASSSKLLAQTPKPAASVSPAIPSVPVNNPNPQTTDAATPSVKPPPAIDYSQLKLLETKIQNLESEIGVLKAQGNSNSLIPVLLSGLAGAILGAIVGGLLMRKIPFLKDSSKQKEDVNDGIQVERDTTTQYLNATISHISTTVKNMSRKIEDLEARIPSTQTDSKKKIEPASTDFPTFNPDIFLQDRELPTAELVLQDIAAIPELVATYNSDPNALFFKGIEVVESAESLSNRRLSGNQLVVFENKRNGDYLIVKEKRIEYLIPKPDLKVNEDKYWLLETIFDCRNYSSNYSYFKLIEPARVLGILGGVNWSLEHKGILEFH